jgi:hypothetical protein
MKITKGTHKSLLFSLFYQLGTNPYTGQSAMMPKEFVLEKLADAGGAKKKIMPKIEQVNETQQRMSFEDSEVEFVPGEVVILKELFDGKKNWSVDDAEIVKELKDIFYPIN